jgi:SH3-like domain-containing protein
MIWLILKVKGHMRHKLVKRWKKMDMKKITGWVKKKVVLGVSHRNLDQK